VQIVNSLTLTARQYGEVVLPDASRPEGSIPESGNIVSEAGKGGYGTCFCSPGTNFITCWRDPGTRLIGAASLSPVTKLGAGTSAVSGYKLSRSKKSVKGYWILIACRCACPGAKTITNLSVVQK
jgi:hypothetical protein